MAAAPLPLDEDTEPLEGAEPELEEDTPDLEGDSGVDPMFAADISEAFPDLDDAQVAALQRAVLSLISGGGGTSGPPMAPLGF